MAWMMLDTVGFVVVILVLLYYYFTATFDFWQKRGVKGPKPVPFFGTFWSVFRGTNSPSDCFTDAYYNYKDEQLVGLFVGSTPLLVVKDPELMKNVLIKDFNCFAERTLTPVKEVEPLSVQLFRLDAARWKPLRIRISPIFSSGKLRDMFPLVMECVDHFESNLEKLVATGEPVECKEIVAKLSIDVIGSCAFGIEMNALTAKDCEFHRMGRRAFPTDFTTYLKDRLRDYPFLFKNIGRLFLVDHELVEFFTRITREAMEYRIKHNFHRHDFIDVLVDFKQHPDKLGLQGIFPFIFTTNGLGENLTTLRHAAGIFPSGSINRSALDDEYAAAQAFVFFAAGFETTSLTVSHALYEFALHPEAQEKARADIKEVLRQTNGVITYDCINEMKYLDACLHETLRKYPTLLYLSRMAQSDYTFSGTNVSIPKGTKVFLPMYAIQRDPEIFPEPEVFNPDRFIDGSAASRHPMHFLPFGDGPRNCIGARFAKIQVKVTLIKVLSNFKVDVCEKTSIPYIQSKRQLFLLKPDHGMYVKMTKLEE